ncbi:hypothetical protein LMG33818_001872 [Halomonadaceae bacterium LMG 33818]
MCGHTTRHAPSAVVWVFIPWSVLAVRGLYFYYCLASLVTLLVVAEQGYCSFEKVPF